MRVLLIGSGGREHALAWKLAQSPLLDHLFIAPGNPGTAQHGTNVPLDVGNHQDIIAFCRQEHIGFVIIGPEAPLVAGIVDDLEAAGIPAFGPSKEAARLEGSKAFTKELCQVANIPTAAFARFTDAGAAKEYVRGTGTPIVIKADGLAAGKGVVVASTLDEALAAIDMIFGGAFGSAGVEIVVEECLFGEEASFFALVDGHMAVPLASAQDHNRVGDGSTQAQCRSSLVKAVGSGRWRVAFEVWVRLRVIALERRLLRRQPPDPRHTSVWQSLPLLHNAQLGCRMVDLTPLEARVLKNDH